MRSEPVNTLVGLLSVTKRTLKSDKREGSKPWVWTGQFPGSAPANDCRTVHYGWIG